MTRWIEFNIHDYAHVRVDAAAPTAPLLDDMFGPFRSQALPHHDLTISGELKPLVGASDGETEYRYTENAVEINALNVQVLKDEHGFRLNGRRELLVSALPLIDRIMISRGAAMVHAATVDYQGQGVCLPAWGGVGKTSTIAKLLRIEGVSFMGDDWAFLNDNGQLLGYQKPMFIKPHHRPIYPHLFQEKRKPLVPVRYSRQLGKMTTLVHPLMTRYPRFARVTRQLSPEHMTVTPERAFPSATFSTSAPLRLAMFVERFDGAAPVLEERDTAWMVSRMIGNFHAELSRWSRDVVTALGATGLMPTETYFHEKALVLEQALAGTPSWLLKVPRDYSPDRASDTIVAHVQETLSPVLASQGR